MKHSSLRRLKRQVDHMVDLFLNFTMSHVVFAVNSLLMTSWLILSWLVFLAESPNPDANIKTLEQAFWWGVVTLLTVGYGDHYPVTEIGKVLAILLMTAGVIAVSIITAKISLIFLENALKTRRGEVDAETIQDHIIVCGWKEDMQDLLCHILQTNEDVTSDQLVLINDNDHTEINALRTDRILSHIKFIKGPFFHEIHLKRAIPERARKVIVLADRTPSANGQVPTVTEVDARTIMTAMTINNIAKGVPVVAEVLDSSMDQYLRIANVNEIVYSRDYSRLLLGKASKGMGITNIVHDLLTQSSGANLTTIEIPEEFIEKTYEELNQYFKSNFPKTILLGILENSGNSHQVKTTALRRAQMTPNVTELVSNLQSVKNMRFNQPLFSPDPDHIIHDGALAMVIQKAGEANAF